MLKVHTSEFIFIFIHITHCLHLHGFSDKGGKWWAYIGFEEGRLREWANQRQ
jgi:hypothetical protein